MTEMDCPLLLSILLSYRDCTQIGSREEALFLINYYEKNSKGYTLKLLLIFTKELP